MQTITAFTQDLRDYLTRATARRPRAFIRSFVKEIAVAPGEATIRYAIPLPADSCTPGRGAAADALKSPVLSTVPYGRAYGIRTRDLHLERVMS